jgi:hypothetical protein
MTLTDPAAAMIAHHLSNLSNQVPPQDERGARDWSGFFQALILAFKELAPIIIPLFLEKQPTKE